MRQLSLGLTPARTPRALALRSYHPSSPKTTVEQALAGEKRAATQEQVILALFRAYEGESFTPSEVANRVNRGRSPEWPITSIRRSLTNLTERGALRRLPVQRMGPLGSPEHAWSLAE